MTDRIRSEFERWATDREFPDLTQSRPLQPRRSALDVGGVAGSE